MLVIRGDQMKAFDDAQRRRFDDAAVDHVREQFPDEYKTRGEVSVRLLVSKAVERASVYGITGKADVFSWISLMLALGEEFDADPDHQWMQDILKSPLLDADGKVNALFEELPHHAEE